MNLAKYTGLAIASGIAVLVTSCGGDSTPVASSSSITSFVTGYNTALKSTKGLNDPAFLALIDDSFLDDGVKKADIAAAIKADSDAIAANPTTLAADSIYPVMSIDAATLSKCNDTTGICDMTANYVNPASDGSTVSLTVPVRFKDGQFLLYGNQAAS